MARSKEVRKLRAVEEIDPQHLEQAPASDRAALREYRRRMREASRRVFTRPPVERYWEWAEKYLKLPNGDYRQSAMEVARGPMSAPTEPGVREITVMCATQMMKTTLLEVVSGYHIHRDPTKMLFLQPKDDLVRAFAREKINPNIARTKVLRDRVRPMLGREGDSTNSYKAFPGGSALILSSGSASNLAMLKFRILLFDEIDKYVDTREGDAIGLALKRTTQYPYNSLVIQVCSPTNGKSRIAASYERSDKRRPTVRCHECDHVQQLDWGDADTLHGVKWDKRGDGSMKEHLAETATYACAGCGCLWSDQERQGALRNTKWYQTRLVLDSDGSKVNPLDFLNTPERWEWNEWAQVHYFIDPPTGQRLIPNRHAGFQAGSLFNPAKSLEALVRSFVEQKDSPHTLQVFVNTDLGLPFEDQGEEVDTASLAARRTAIPFVPDHSHVVVCTVDTQDDRLELVRGALNLVTEKVDVLEHKSFRGDTGTDTPWNALDDYLKQPSMRSDGHIFPVICTLIDVGGHRRDIATRFCNKRVKRNVFAIVGKAEKDGGRSELWPAAASYKNKLRTAIYQLSVNTGKDLLSSKLGIKDASRNGYIAFDQNIHDEFFEQIGNEKAVPTLRDGRWVRLWKPRTKGHLRNEGLDLMVYMLAALRAVQGMPVPTLKAFLPPPPKVQAVVPVAPATPAKAAPTPRSAESAGNAPAPATKDNEGNKAKALPSPKSATGKLIKVPKGFNRRR